MNEIKDFVISFFNILKCSISENGGIYTIDNIPEEFENIFEKSGPYNLVFERENDNENNEFVGKGSFLLKTIGSFLENKGRATLLKINFDINENKVKGSIKLEKCKIDGISTKIEYDYFVRFGFLTDFQYLSEKEQETNYVYVENEKVIQFDLQKYKLEDGERKDINVKNIDKEYEIAKKEVKEIIKVKKLQLGDKIKINLEKEINRIKNHYSNQINEIENSLIKNNTALVELEREKKLGKTGLDNKIERIKENISKINISKEKERLEKEESFVLNDELHKHSLNISNKLINTTIIYYPKFTFDFFVRNNKSLRKLQIKYNPLIEESSDLNCETCSIVLKKIMICNSSHLVCEKCVKNCPGCSSEMCGKCKGKKCFLCNRENCKDCVEKCFNCFKDSCKEHLHKDYRSGKLACYNCLKQCNQCKDYCLKNNIKSCRNCGKEMCNKCAVFKINSEGCVNCVK